jgi:hypothetical protein
MLIIRHLECQVLKLSVKFFVVREGTTSAPEEALVESSDRPPLALSLPSPCPLNNPCHRSKQLKIAQYEEFFGAEKSSQKQKGKEMCDL